MSTKRYWTTLEDLKRDPAVEKLRGEEFRAKPKEHFDALPQGGLKVGRRDFFKWSTAALALAASACERKPTEAIIPYVNQPPELLPGVANWYASTCRECAAGCGTLVKTREGRPIKVEGNPLHPVNRGTLCPRGQSALMNLYDPDRLRNPVRLERTHSLEGLVGNAGQPRYDLHQPTNIWNQGDFIRTNPHPITRKLQAMSWEQADRQVAGWLAAAGGRAVVLTGTWHGPARSQLMADFLGLYGARHVVYDAINFDALAAAQQGAYGTAALPRYLFERAEMVLTLGGDPLGAGYSRQEHAIGIGRQRKVRENRMSRLVTIEPAMSLTGLNADSRYLVAPSQLLPVALALAAEVGRLSRFGGDAGVTRALAGVDAATVEKNAGLPAGTIAALAGELWSNRGKSIVYASSLAASAGDPAQLEMVAAFLNAALENEGATIDGSGSPSLQAQGRNGEMLRLVEDMNQGKVQTLLVYGTNPAYTMPANSGFAEALAKVPQVAVYSERLDETAQLGDLALPALHGMESWGDAEPQAGLYSLVQPTINPLFGGRSIEDSLIQLGFLTPAGATKFKAKPPAPAPVPPPVPGVTATPAAPTGTATAATAAATAQAAKTATAAAAPAAAPATAPTAAAPTTAAAAAPAAPPAVATSFHEYLRDYWQSEIYAKAGVASSFDDFWMGVLRAGVFDPNPRRQQPGPARAYKGTLAVAAMATPPAEGEYELALTVNPVSGDGACNNNGLLMEIPDPVSRICWDNYLAVAPSTAAKNNWVEGDLITLTAGNASVELPLHIQPGVHPRVAAVPVGYGRLSAGQIGTNVGVNAWPLAQAGNGGVVYSGARVRLAKSGSGYLLASPQGDSYLEFDDPIVPELGRKQSIIRDTTLVQLQANPRAGNPEAEPAANLWNASGASSHPYPGIHWGMTIDLNACIGCQACVAACYAENNVPVVGKDQVWRGREMAWIRIDRYFNGEGDNPEVTNQPMLCQQCENAGCESVCPVIATMTDAEGLNVQIYNRCVGTRFCSNNCIYKVRRFNFYNYGKPRATPIELALNPEVTVRSKGIMEKCTFCVQRIKEGHYRNKERGSAYRDGDVVTACQQTCPAEAIYFGDMNDPASRMMRARTERGYQVLEEKNFKPSITYLTKVRNRAAGADDKESA